MVDRFVLNPSAIKVSKPGVDVHSARLDQLLLSIDMRVGQILATGFAALGPVYVERNLAMQDATVHYGPFASPPDILLWIYGSDGYAYPTGCSVLHGGNTQSYAANFDSFFYVDTLSVGPSSTFVKGYQQPYSLLDVTPVGIYYLISRKPFLS